MLLTKLFPWKSSLGEEKKCEQFFACAKQMETKFDMAKVVLPMKSSSLGCTMATLKSKTLLYMSTPECHILGFVESLLDQNGNFKWGRTPKNTFQN